MSTARALAKSSFPILLDDLTFVGFGDCGWGVRRQGSSQGGSLIITADKRILGGFEATTTMVDWKSYTCKRVVCSSLAGETQAHVGTVDMLELTKVFYSLFLDPRKSLSDVEGVCTVLWREVNHQTGFWFSEEQPQRSLQSDTGWNTDSCTQVGRTLTGKAQTDSRNLRRLGSCLRLCLRGDGKSYGTRLSRVQERSSWQNGQKAKEIWMGDEFTATILLCRVAF